MLNEEQAAELLRRCEAIAGRELRQLRGNLRRAETRAEAVWELLVLEAMSHLGPVECEPPGGGPDIRLKLPSGQWLSIEVTYIHPRFDDQEQQCSQVLQWLYQESLRIGPQPVHLECDFVGGVRTDAGTRLKLPAQHERKAFFADPEVSAFIQLVRASPAERRQAPLSNYSILLRARPKVSDADVFTSSSRPALESPTVASEHAAFRALRYKLEQHKPDEPYMVCIGSDVSRVLARDSGFGPQVRTSEALQAAVRRSGRLSAVLLVNVESDSSLMQSSSRHIARVRLMPVEQCNHPLSQQDLQALAQVDLNRWNYSFPLQRREPKAQHRRRNSSGPIRFSSMSKTHIKLALPASVLADVLAGRTTVVKEYDRQDGWVGKQLGRCLGPGWSIVGCEYLKGNVEQGQDALIELELAFTHEPVFWPDAPGKNAGG